MESNALDTKSAAGCRGSFSLFPASKDVYKGGELLHPNRRAQAVGVQIYNTVPLPETDNRGGRTDIELGGKPRNPEACTHILSPSASGRSGGEEDLESGQLAQLCVLGLGTGGGVGILGHILHT